MKITRSGRYGLRGGLFPMPGKEFVEALGGVIGDPAQDVGEPGLGIDAVEFGGADQGVDRSSALAATVGAGEQPGFAPEGNAAQGALGGVVAETDAAVIEKAGKGRPALEHVIHCLGVIGVMRQSGALVAHPGFQFGDERRKRVLRTATLCSAERPLISRSIAKIGSMRRTASAASGDLPASAKTKNLRQLCAQHAASVIGPGRRLASYRSPKPA